MIVVPTVVAALNALGLLLVARRLAGALSEHLSLGAMLLTAIVTTVIANSARLAWRRSFPLPCAQQSNITSADGRFSKWDSLIGWGASLAVLLVAVGCCFPANRTSDWLIWLPLLVADQFWRQSFFDLGEPGRNFTAPSYNTLSVDPAMDMETNLEEEHSALEEEVVQQLFRLRDADGQEAIYGTLRADFQTGQRNAVIHAGFCPPLEYLPVIEAAPCAGPPAQVKVVQAFAHGARLDLRLGQVAEHPCTVFVDMAALPNATGSTSPSHQGTGL